MALKTFHWLFFVYIVSLPLVQLFTFYLFGLKVQAADLLFVAALISAAVAVLSRQISVNANRWYVVIALYAVPFVISTIYSENIRLSMGKLAGVFYLLAIAVLTMIGSRRSEFRRMVVIGLVVGTGLTSLAALVAVMLFYCGFDSSETNLLLSHAGSLPKGNYPRVHALFANANMMCDYLNVGIVATLIAGRLKWIGPKLALVLTAGALISAVLTLSPGLGGIALSVGFWILLQYRELGRRVRIGILAMAVLGAALFFAASLVSPDTSNSDLDLRVPVIGVVVEPSVRVLVWQSAFSNFLTSPLIGKGTGMNAASVSYTTLSGSPQILLDAHNMWLNIAVQTGLLGVAMLTLLTVYTLSTSLKTLPGDKENATVLTGLFCAVVGAFLYHGLTGSFEDARHLWILFGLIPGVAGSGIAERSESVS